MSATRIPSRPAPAVFPPTVMIVPAWVSCCLFSMNRVPSFVVTSSSSGIGPSRMPVAMQFAWWMTAGFISTPMLSRPSIGASKSAMTPTARNFFMRASRLSEGVVELGQAQQMAAVEYWFAGDEHGEGDRVRAFDRVVVPDAFPVPGALDGVCDRALSDLPVGDGDRFLPLRGNGDLVDLEVLAGAVLGEISPRRRRR